MSVLYVINCLRGLMMDKPKLSLVFEVSDIQKQLLELVPKEQVFVESVSPIRAIEVLKKEPPDIIIVPMDEKGYKGQLFEDLQEYCPDSIIILTCTGAQAPEAFELVIEGEIYDYFILKPILEPKRLTITILKVLEHLILKPRTGASEDEQSTEQLMEFKHLYYQTQTTIQELLLKAIPKLQETIYNRSGLLQEDFKASLEIIYGDALQERFEYFKHQVLEPFLKGFRESLGQLDEYKGHDFESFDNKLNELRLNINSQLDLLNMETNSILETIDEENIEVSFENYRVEGLKPAINDHHLQLSENINEVMRSINYLFKKHQTSEHLSRTELIVVIDDSSYDSEFLEVLLKELGFKPIMCMNGQEGLEKIRQFKPDLIILDATMPKMSGYDVINQLKASPDSAKIPIIFMSGGTSQEAVQKLLQEESIVYFIQKPFRLKDISQVIMNQFNIDESSEDS